MIADLLSIFVAPLIIVKPPRGMPDHCPNAGQIGRLGSAGKCTIKRCYYDAVNLAIRGNCG